MDTVHLSIGSLVILAYLVSLVVNVLGMRGQRFSWSAYPSMAGSVLLVVQVVLGFSLLGEGESNAAAHYVLAVAALLSLGLEHGYARSQATVERRMQWGAIANAVTLVLLLVTYIVGQTNAT